MIPSRANMGALSSNFETVVVGLGLVLVLVLLAQSISRLDRWRRRRRIRRRLRRARRAEKAAEVLLRDAGYRLCGHQVRGSWPVRLQGEERRYTVIADYIVEKGGQSWVAEVKSGEIAPDLRLGATRRQLLEYQYAFDVCGVLLVDAERGLVQSVEFPLAAQRVSSGSELLANMVTAASVLVFGSLIGWVAHAWLSGTP